MQHARCPIGLHFLSACPPPPKRGRRRGAKALLTYRISALSPSFFRSSRDVTYKNALVTACLEEDNEKRGELSCLSSSTASAFYEQKKAREKKKRKKKNSERQHHNTPPPPAPHHSASLRSCLGPSQSPPLLDAIFSLPL